MKENLYWTKINKHYKHYPSLNSNETCDVVIIGGGISGCITSYYLASYNIDTILLEKNSLAENSISRSLGFIEDTTDLSILELKKYIGEKKALKANLFCKKSLDNLENNLFCNDCLHLIEHKNVKYIDTTTNDSTFKNCIIVDPLKLCHTLLKKSQKKNCKIYENTNALGYDYFSGEIKVKTSNSHYIKCKKIIFTDIFSSYKLIKEWELLEFFNAHYIVTKPICNLNKDFFQKYSILKDNDDIYTYIRPTKDNRLMLSEFKGGSDEDKATYLLSKLQDILNYSKDLNIDYYFNKTYGESPDCLPYIGQHPKFNNCYFNLALGRNNICYSLIGAEILKDLILYNDTSHTDLFSFERL
ncbi:NAD(P)/FAD-dependent oxidoreductase [Clostridium botulinum]|uniref:NAD(P)/FAD-dependent oxidoreductase n=1 Tax=Clostridium botulinum TaxID=1491 RepID=UPI0004D4634C|nr:FAD-binding oxidoreductase [Clostridium botulinum]KEI06670.1 hypothetical protein Z952_03690 [Clostridium botulinum C/D str. BKT75002]MCD3351288.1 FAD-binding oxidoreductase [Clostridium botulinum D/C]MCD3360245.1 FAD-binding oxidoreductase [Clostridium botulinum D/C]MCD3362352.1 FAD-binding oxidoreductase [Clostridium botulinum D/C]MCD3366050.1 FAD-binding oxidoreductase [Clostridium botulinum D/C]